MVLLFVGSQFPPILVDCCVRAGTLLPNCSPWELSWGSGAIQQRQRRRQQRRSRCPDFVSLGGPSVSREHRLPRPPGRPITRRRVVRDRCATSTPPPTPAMPGPCCAGCVPRWCLRPPRPHGAGHAPAAFHSAPQGPPRPPGGLAWVARSPGSLGHRWLVAGGGPAAAALASAGVCDMVAFLVGPQQPDSFRTYGRY